MLSRVLLLGICVLAVASCTGTGHGGPSVAPAASYAGEPYKVRMVDRSRFDKRFWPVTVAAPINAPEGSILIDTQQRFLYLFGKNGSAKRYGVAVGAAGHSWSGTATIGRKAVWPAWYPTDDMHQQTPDLPRRIEPGPANPLGARALYLFEGGADTLYRIHGTSEPWTIGTEASSGCIRMLNEDIIDLYARVEPGATVIVR